jgi:putative peptide zinc metalloprotease protein
LTVHGIDRVYYTSDGSAVRCSAAAFEILQGAEEGRSDDEVAERLSAIGGPCLSASQVIQARHVALAKIAGICRKKNLHHQGIFWHRQIVGPAATARLSRPLQPLFHPGLAVALLGIALLTYFSAGWIMLASGWHHYVVVPTEVQAIGAYLVFLLILVMHEAGHAAALHRFGGTAGGAGVGLFIVFPFFYTDVTRSWSLRSSQRVIVDLGGLYIQVLVMAPMLLVCALHPAAWLMMALGLAASTCALAANPFLRNDGYWALSDLLDRPALKQDAYRRLWAAWRHAQRPGGLELYAAADMLFLLTLMGVAIRGAWLSLRPPAGSTAWSMSWLMLTGSTVALAFLVLRLRVTLRRAAT